MRSAPTARIREQWQYNNYMYLAAGEALAAAHQSTFEQVMSELVFLPLKMRSTNLSTAVMTRSQDFSFGFSSDSPRRQLPTDTLAYLSGITPAGGLNSNAEDMAQWLRLMLAGGVLDGRRLVSETGFRELHTPAVTTPVGKGYGLGWFIEDWHGHRLVNHGGGVIGFGARCDLLPALGLGWVVLTNVDDLALPNSISSMSSWRQPKASSRSSGCTHTECCNCCYGDGGHTIGTAVDRDHPPRYQSGDHHDPRPCTLT